MAASDLEANAGGGAEARAWHSQLHGGTETSCTAPPPRNSKQQEGHLEDAPRQGTETSSGPPLQLLLAQQAPQPPPAALAYLHALQATLTPANEEELTAEPILWVPGSITGVKSRPGFSVKRTHRPVARDLWAPTLWESCPQAPQQREEEEARRPAPSAAPAAPLLSTLQALPETWPDNLHASQASTPLPARPTPAAHLRPCAQGEDVPQLRARSFDRWLAAEFKDLELPPALDQQHSAATAAEPLASATVGEPCDPATLHAGGFAYAKGLRNRPALNYEVLGLLWFHSAADCWVCAVGDGEQVRFRQVNLVPVPDIMSGDEDDP